VKAIFRAASMALSIVLLDTAWAQTSSKHSGEQVSWPSIVCRGAKCEPLLMRGYLFAKAGQKNVVIVSHGSVGVDYRVFDRVDKLNEAGFAALVPEHWASRGLGEILTDLKGGPGKGASELNMAFDIYTAASWLRRERDFDKVGAIGASYGGGAQITAQQAWAKDVMERTFEYHYKKSLVVRALDAQVSLYGFCGYRNKLRDKFNGAPLLFINGEKDEIAPAALCEQIGPWMNERGGNVKVVTLKGAYHTFDARERATWIGSIQHMGKCDLLVDEKGITNVKTGVLTPGENNSALPKAVEGCTTARGFTSGHSGDPGIAVPLWIGFFKEHMPSQ
jgi:dienelactone hydrolase